MGERITLQIIDPLGKVVMHREADGNQRLAETMDLQQHAKGVYVIRITGNTINYTDKMIVR